MPELCKTYALKSFYFVILSHKFWCIQSYIGQHKLEITILKAVEIKT